MASKKNNGNQKDLFKQEEATPESSRPSSATPAIRFETLEPRVLLSADPAPIISGAIDVPGETDRYEFTLNTDTSVVFDALTNNSSLTWTLNGPGGAVIPARAFTATDGTSLATTPVLQLQAGTYTITIDAPADQTPSYAFRLIDLSRSEQIQPNTVVTRQLSPGNETDAFRFDVTAGDKYFFDLKSVSQASTSWRLIDPFGRQVFSPVALADRDVTTMAFTGSYTLLVEGALSITTPTDYSFSLVKVVDTVTPLEIGSTVNGAIAQPGQRGMHTFSLATAERLYFDSFTNSSSVNWTLIGPAGTLVSARTFTTSDAFNGSPFLDLIAGDYTLIVDTAGEALPSYSFRLLNLEQGVAVTPGALVSGELTPANETDVYRFSAAAGDKFLFDSQTSISANTVSWRLLNPLGVQVFSSTMSSDVGSTTLSLTGTYTLIVEGAVGVTGTRSYSFNIVPQGNTPPAPFPEGTPLTLNSTVSSAISVAGEKDYYRFTLTEATRLYFDSLTLNASLNWTLAGPQGTVVNARPFTSANNNSEWHFAPMDLLAGEYLLTLAGSTTSTGNYSFRLVETSSAALIEAGVVVNSSLNPGNESDLYYFDATVGDKFYFDFLSSSAGSTNVVTWRLVDPLGRTVFIPWMSDVDVTTLSMTGRYLLLVEGDMSRTTATNYSFKVEKIVDTPVPITIGESVGLEPQWEAGKLEGGLRLDGLQHVELDNVPAMDLTQNVTIESWIKFDRFNHTWTPIFYKGDGARFPGDATDYLNRTLGVWVASDGRLHVASNDGASQQVETAAGVVTTNQWYHIAAVIDRVGGKLRLYVDGVEKAVANLRTTAAVVSNSPLIIGTHREVLHSSSDVYGRLEGTIDEVRVWNTVRTAAQIAASRDTELSGTEAGLLSYLKANDGSGTVLADASGQGHDGLIRSLLSPTAGAVAGQLAYAGQEQSYTFTLTEQTNLFFDSLTNNASLSWKLTGPRGEEVAWRQFSLNDWDYVPLDLVAGDYTLTVGGSAETIGNYAFRLVDTSTVQQLTPGVAVSGELNPGRESELYAFDVTAGDRFYFDFLGSNTASTTNHIAWRVIDPLGNELFNPWMADIEVTTLTQTGRYLLLVEGIAAQTTSMAYSFKIEKVVDVPVAITIGQSTGLEPQWVEGRLGEGVRFNGLQYLEVDNDPALDLTGSVTLEGWFKVDRFANSWMPIFYKGDGDPQRRSISVWLNADGRLQVNSGDGGNQWVETAAGLVKADEWAHIAAVADRVGGRLRLYVNGIERASLALRTTPAGSSSTPLLIGHSMELHDAYALFEGVVDEVRVWSGVRTAAQIGADMNDELTGSEAGLLAYLKANEGSGALLADSSGNGHDGLVRNLQSPTSGTVADRLTYAGQEQSYTFTLSEARNLYFDSLTNNSTLYWKLTGPRGEEVSWRQFTAIDWAVAPMGLVAGTYTLTVTGNVDAIGNYAFRLVDTTTAQLLTPGTVVNGQLEPGREADHYYFDAVAGERFYFDFLSSNVGTTSRIAWGLIDPSGKDVFNPWMADVDITGLPLTGRYYLVVEGDVSQSLPLNYSFNVEKVVDVPVPITIGESVGIDPQWVDGRLGGGIHLDGLQHIEVGNSPALNFSGSVTAEAWIKVDRFASNSMPIFIKSDAYESPHPFELYLTSSGYLELHSDDMGGDQILSTAAGTITTNQWYHVAAVADRVSGKMRIYVNGVEKAAGNLRTSSAGVSNSALAIGRKAHTWIGGEAYANFEGTIDEVRVWNTVRTAAEIASNKDIELTGSEAGLQAYLKANDGNGAQLVDSSGNGRHAVIINPMTLASGAIEGRLTYAGQEQSYTFTLGQATQIYFDTLTNNSALNWKLTGPRGEEVPWRQFTAVNDWGFSPMNLVAGDYMLTVGASGAAVGNYAFRLVDTSTAVQLTPGTVVNGELYPAREVHFYYFDAQAGDRYYFDFLGSNRDPVSRIAWGLLDPSGKDVFNPWMADVDVTTLPLTGRYYLMVEGDIAHTMPLTYSFKIEQQVQEVTPIVIGQSTGLEPQWADGKFGTGVYLDGLQHIEVGNDPVLDLTRSLTAEAWVEFDRFTNNWTPIFYKGDGVYEHRTFTLWLHSDGYLHLTTEDGTHQSVSTAAGVIKPGQRYHIAAVMDRVTGRMRIYVDGVERANTALRTTSSSASSTPLLVGMSREPGAYGLLEGTIDEVRVWSTVRTAAEIAANKDIELTGSEAGLQVYLKANEGSGALLADSSGKGRDGTIQNRQGPTSGAVAGQLAYPGDSQAYTFTLEQPAQLLFDSLTLNGSLSWRLEGPRGEVVAWRSFTATDWDYVPMDLVAGNYKLTVEGTGAAIGNFAFRLIDTSSAEAIIPSTVVSGQLIQGRDTDLYYFDAVAGDRYYFDLLSQSFSTSTDLLAWRLIDPSGKELFNPWLVDADVTTLPYTGRYLLLVEGAISQAGTLNYSFRIEQQVQEVTPIMIGQSTGLEPQWVDGKFGEGVHLDGLQYVEVGNDPALDLTGSVTAEAWIKVDRFSARRTPIFHKGDNDTSTTDGGPDLDKRTFGLDVESNGSLRLFSGDGVGQELGTAAGLIKANEWYHVAAVTDRVTGRMRIYVNGVEVANSVMRTKAATASTAPLRIGMGDESWQQSEDYANFEGTIDEVRVWSGVRTAVQIAANKDSELTGSEGGLLVNLRLNEGEGSLLADSSTNNRNASIQTILGPNSGTVAGRLTYAGDSQAYTFTLAQDARIYFDSLTNDSSMTWKLTGPRGEEVPFRAFTTADWSSAPLNLIAGNYTLTVEANGAATGNFAFRLVDVATAIPITPGTPVSSELNPGNQTHLYAIDANAGDQFFFDMITGAIDPAGDVAWILLDPAGRTVWTPRSMLADMPVMTFSYSGRYLLVVDGFVAQDQPSPYSFNVEYRGNVPPAALPAATPLTLGATTAGTLSTTAQKDYYSFRVTEKSRIYIDSLTNTAGIRWSLTGVHGAIVTNRTMTTSDSADQASPVFELVAGTYTVMVDGTTAGGYSFRVDDLAQATAISVSTVVNGQLSPANETELYRFDATAGEKFFFDRIGATFGNAYWRLIDPFGRVVPGFDVRHMDNVAGPLTLAYTGSYTLLVEGRVSAGGTISYSFNAQKLIDQVAPLSLNTVVTGTIDHVRQTDAYTFTLDTATRIYVDALANISGMKWTLTGPYGQIATRTFLTSDATDSSTPVYDLAAGSYTLALENTVDRTSPYSFRVMDLAQATAIPASTVINGQLNPANESDMYRFDAIAGEKFFFDRLGASFGNAYWRLIDPFGRVVPGFEVRSMDSVVGPLTLAYSGSYTLLVEGRYNATGTINYSFNAQKVVDEVIPLTLNAVVSGNIDHVEQTDIYSFSVSEETFLYFDAFTNNTGMKWTLVGPQGQVGTRTFPTSDSTDSSAPVYKLVPGSYSLLIENTVDRTSAYSFRVANLAQATAIPVSTVINGQLSPANETELYRFDATAGEKFYFDRLGASFGNVYWRLIDPFGRVVPGFESRSMDLVAGPLTLAYSGSYTLLVEGRNNATGTINYTFNVQKLVDEVIPLTLNTVVNGTIDHVAQTDVYTFTVEATKRVYFDSFTNSAGVRWSLVGPRGTVVTNRTFTTSDGFDVGTGSPAIELVAGTYQLRIDSTIDRTPTYSFRLADLTQATEINPGMAVTGQLNGANETDTFRFDAVAGSQYYFDRTSVSGGDVYWRLLDPFGRVVAGFDRTSMASDVGVLTLNYTGTYTLLVEGRITTTGLVNYAFNAVPLSNAKVVLTGLGDEPGPDLIVQNVALAPVGGALQSGGQALLSWETLNAGNRPTAAGWQDRVVIRNAANQVIGSYLVSYSNESTTPLQAGESRARQITVTLPEGNAGIGNFTFQVTTDVGNTVTETGATAEQNNNASVTAAAQLAPYADLQVGNVAVTPAGAWLGGAPVTVSWRVSNTGDKAVTAAWNDLVLVRSLTTGQVIATASLRYDPAQSGELAATGGLNRSYTFNWPQGVNGIGQFEFVVTSDLGNEIVENNATNTGENNNSSKITATSGPDLLVRNLRVEQSVVEAGGQVLVQWETWNDGAVPVPAGFTDRIVITNRTTGEKLFDAAVAYDPAQSGAGLIVVGDFRARSYSFRLPDGVRGAGDIEISVTADQGTGGQGTLYETNAASTAETNNNATVHAQSAAKPYANLKVSNVQAPVSGFAGEPVTLTWNVVNNGAIATAGAWNDQIILSSDPTFGNADDVVVTTLRHTGVLAVGEGYSQTATVKLPFKPAGRYYLAVKTDSAAEVLEPDTRADNTSTAAAIDIVTPYTDLVVQSISIPATALSGENIQVSWVVTNTGTGTTDLSFWNDKLVLSRDVAISADDIVLSGSVTHTGFLAPGASYTGQATVSLPRDASGEYYVLIDTSTARTVTEANKTNNVTASPAKLVVTLAPTADLQVGNVSGPVALRPGDAATVTYTASNHGTTAATGPWIDRIYLDRGAAGLLEVGSVFVTATLEVGVGVQRNATFVLPANLADGDYRWVVKTDTGDNLYERGNETNNQATSADIVRVQRIDLGVTQVSGPGLVQSGGSAEVSWTVVNTGGVAIGTWVDHLFLQKGTTLRKVGEVSHSGPIATGESYTGTASITVPVDFSGEYEIVVINDATNVLADASRTNNTSRQALTVSLAPYADIAVTAVDAPERVIADPAPLTVSWTVSNVGNGAGFTGSWTDRVILSKNDTFGDSDDWVVGELRHEGGLEAGASYDGSISVLLPPATWGRYKVFVVSDAKSEVFENNSEANNIGRDTQELQVMPVAYADLQVQSVSTPDQAFSGRPITVSWSVINNGIGITNTASWSDEVWLSRNPDGSGLVANLGSASRIGQLAVGDHYTRSIDVLLPQGIEGDFFLNVRTAGGSTPFEFDLKGNNTGTSLAVPVTLSLSPDLVVENIELPESAQEGAVIDVSWTVLNQGEAKAEGLWVDTVYLIPVSGGSAVTLGSFTYDRGLESGIRYTRTEQLRLPAKIEGLYRIKVVTNVHLGGSGAQVYEYGGARSNNSLTSTDTTQVSLNDRPDLRVAAVVVPEHVTAGTSASLRYTVSNLGPTAATGQWKDRVYLSLDGNLSSWDPLESTCRHASLSIL